MRNYLAAGILLLAFSCTNSNQKAVENSTDTAATNSTKNTKSVAIPVELNDTKVQHIYDGYIALKNALVNTKFEDAKKAAEALKLNLANYKGCENTAVTAGKIATADDIATQRKEFTALSSDVIAMFKHADLKSGSIYVQHCPMANNGDGGDWLASEKNIRNPYYGDEMMECGAVLEEIKKVK